MEFEIDEIDAQTLRQLCGLTGAEPLPEKLLAKYHATKIVCDRGQSPLRNEFVRICVECGFGKLTQREANPDVATLWRRKTIQAGQPVLVNWREKKVAGKLVGLNAVNEFIVLIEGEERKIKADCVTLQAAA